MMMPPLLRYFWFHSIYSLAASCSLQSAVCKCHTPSLYCQHWHFNSVIENYVSGKLVCTVAYCLMTVINQPSSFQSRFLYSKLSYCLLQCGLAWGYSCCFHFSELVTRQSFNCATDFCIFKSTALCETALHYTKQTTINKQILCRFQKNFFQRSKKWHSLSFFPCFAPCRAFLWVFCRFTSQERTNVHRTAFFFIPLISHCLKSQLSK